MKFAFCMFIIGSNGSVFLLAPAENADPQFGCVLVCEQNKGNLKGKKTFNYSIINYKERGTLCPVFRIMIRMVYVYKTLYQGELRWLFLV